jgi:long-chain acyl-CoA synthetase
MAHPMASVLRQPMAGGETASASIGRAFFAQARRVPDKTAIRSERAGMTYRELAQLAARWSNAMAAHGVARGDHVAVILPNTVEFVALILVAADLGAVLIPLATTLAVSDVFKAFGATGVRHVVGTRALLEPLLHDPLGRQNAVEGLWLSVDDPIHDGSAKVVRSLTGLMHDVPADIAPLHAGLADDALILSMTSGSTGDPKPIILTQRTKFNRARAAVELYSITEHDRVLAATPLYHSLAERLVLIPLLTGGTSILLPRFSPAGWLQCVRVHRVSFTIAVSSQLKQIVAELGETARCGDIVSLRCIVSSSALLDPETKADLLRIFDCEFHECYGASEIAIASNLDDRSARIKLKSVGKAAPGVEIKIIGADGRALGPGEAGEIVCKTPMLFGGYFKRPDLTRLAMWGDYFRTGDIGKLDDQGFLYFLGRSKDIIITGGINVYPSDIESVVNGHPSVLESAAFAFPDERLGEVVAVALVAADGANFDLRKLRFHCCALLADFQQPRKFFVMPELPKNSMGKLMKFRLGELFAGPVAPTAESHP